MKVSELIERLSHTNGDLPVYHSYDSGDHWGSIVASKVSDIDEIELVYSQYHQKMSVPKNPDEKYEDDDEKTVNAIVLS